MTARWFRLHENDSAGQPKCSQRITTALNNPDGTRKSDAELIQDVLPAGQELDIVRDALKRDCPLRYPDISFIELIDSPITVDDDGNIRVVFRYNRESGGAGAKEHPGGVGQAAASDSHLLDVLIPRLDAMARDVAGLRESSKYAELHAMFFLEPSSASSSRPRHLVPGAQLDLTPNRSLPLVLQGRLINGHCIDRRRHLVLQRFDIEPDAPNNILRLPESLEKLWDRGSAGIEPLSIVSSGDDQGVIIVRVVLASRAYIGRVVPTKDGPVALRALWWKWCFYTYRLTGTLPDVPQVVFPSYDRARSLDRCARFLSEFRLLPPDPAGDDAVICLDVDHCWPFRR